MPAAMTLEPVERSSISSYLASSRSADRIVPVLHNAAFRRLIGGNSCNEAQASLDNHPYAA
jgi:hypothetical protein